MRVINKQKETVQFNLTTGEYLSEDGFTQEFYPPPKTPEVRFKEIVKKVKGSIICELYETLEKEGLAFSKVYLGGSLSHLKDREGLTVIEDAHKYSKEYLENMSLLSTHNALFLNSLQEKVFSRVEEEIKNKEYAPEIGHRVLLQLKRYKKRTNENDEKKFHICLNHVIGFKLELVGWVKIKL